MKIYQSTNYINFKGKKIAVSYNVFLSHNGMTTWWIFSTKKEARQKKKELLKKFQSK